MSCGWATRAVAAVTGSGLPRLNRALPEAKRAGAWVTASVIGGVAAPPLLGIGIEGAGISDAAATPGAALGGGAGGDSALGAARPRRINDHSVGSGEGTEPLGPLRSSS